MPAFSQRSQDRLDSCHPDLQVIFNEIIQHTDCTIICGHRSEAEQTKAFEARNSQVQYPNSKHNQIPSMAVAVAPYFKDIGLDWSDIKAFSVFAGVVKEVTRRLREEGRINTYIRWGGDWDSDGRTNDQDFDDLPHFELVAG